MSKSKNQKGCWYEIFVHECPVCGRGETFRERRDPPRPADPEKRYHWAAMYDWCNER
jgi:hypothetical protein